MFDSQYNTVSNISEQTKHDFHAAYCAPVGGLNLRSLTDAELFAYGASLFHCADGEQEHDPHVGDACEGVDATRQTWEQGVAAGAGI